jgi:hypothetical protein
MLGIFNKKGKIKDETVYLLEWVGKSGSEPVYSMRKITDDFGINLTDLNNDSELLDFLCKHNGDVVALAGINQGRYILESQGYKVKIKNKGWSVYVRDI